MEDGNKIACIAWQYMKRTRRIWVHLGNNWLKPCSYLRLKQSTHTSKLMSDPREADSDHTNPSPPDQMDLIRLINQVALPIIVQCPTEITNRTTHRWIILIKILMNSLQQDDQTDTWTCCSFSCVTDLAKMLRWYHNSSSQELFWKHILQLTAMGRKYSPCPCSWDTVRSKSRQKGQVQAAGWHGTRVAITQPSLYVAQEQVQSKAQLVMTR